MTPLRADAAQDCAHLHASSFPYPWSQQTFEELIINSNAIGTAAQDPVQGRLRGFALSRILLDEAELLTLIVDPALRKAGIGRDILQAHLSQVALAGAGCLFLEVDENNAAALALYARFDFMIIGRREAYYRQHNRPATTALTMRRDLRR